MKSIILTCNDGHRKPSRFLIEIDENTGDAQIVNDSAPRIERDRSAVFVTDNGYDSDDKRHKSFSVVLTVEAA